MNRKILLSGFGAFVLALSSMAQADIVLFDYGFNIDGTVSVPTLGDPVPAEADISGFDDLTGIGDIVVTVSGAGAHFVDLFVDHDIDAAINTFFNETGSSTGTPAAGQSWEIDEPGFGNGDIFENFQASLLDNNIGASIYGATAFPDDVSMALGWDFVLGAGETAEILFSIARTAPAVFYLTHTDPDSDIALYFSSAISFEGGGTQVPEPGTLWLLGAGLLGLGLSRRKVS